MIVLYISIIFVHLQAKTSIHPVSMCILAVNAGNKTMSHTISKLVPGNYSIRVGATTAVTNGIFSDKIYVYLEEPPTNTVLIVCLVLCFCLAVNILRIYLTY